MTTKAITPKLRRIILEAFKQGVSMVFIAEDQQILLYDVERVIREVLKEQEHKP